MILKEVNGEKQWYIYRQSERARTDKILSFEYAWKKAKKCYGELIKTGFDCAEPLAANVGREGGFNDYVNVTNECDLYYELTGLQIEAMLRKDLRNYEGCKVKATNESGKTEQFYILRYGRAVPYYIKVKEPKKGRIKGGKRITDKYKNIIILGTYEKDKKALDYTE